MAVYTKDEYAELVTRRTRAAYNFYGFARNDGLDNVPILVHAHSVLEALYEILRSSSVVDEKYVVLDCWTAEDPSLGLVIVVQVAPFIEYAANLIESN